MDGVQQYVVAIGEWLRGQGHDVHYLVGQTQKRQLPNIHSLARNIGVRFNGNRTTIPLPPSRRKLRRFVQAEKFDILHIQTPHHPLLAQRLILAAGPETAIVGTFHILPYSRMVVLATKALGLWLRPSLRRFDQMLAVTAVAAEFEKRCFGLDAKILPNVIDYRLFSAAKGLEKYADDKPTILFLGRLVARKGCLTLLEAIATLLKEGSLPHFRVVICGRGPLEGELRQFVRTHDLANTVEFTGFVNEDDKPRYFASADISVFPSSGGESFGIVLLEAMASGKAIVLAGDNPGYRTVMADRAEQLFPATDVTALTSLLRHYLLGAGARQAGAAWGKAHVRQYDIEVIGPQLVDYYVQALSRARNLS
jgi:phosphatidylinositol alpha-mannosyltransferase